MDWFVASALAQQGRMNGFVSAVQDPMLTGYAAGSPTAVGIVGTQALLSALEQMTYVPDSVRDGFVAQWADPKTIDPVLLVRRVLGTPVSWRGVWRQTSPVRMPSLRPRFSDEVACLVGDDSPGGRARARLLELAVDARAHGAARRRATYRAWADRPVWAHSVLGTPPWAPAEGQRVIDELRDAIVAELATAPADQGLVSPAPAIFRSRAASCSSIDL